MSLDVLAVNHQSVVFIFSVDLAQFFEYFIKDTLVAPPWKNDYK